MSYISSAFPRFVEPMEPHEIAFQLAKSGKVRQLKQYLNRRNKEERKSIVSCKYNGATSLIMACRNGHFEVVEYVVEYCMASLEQTGLVNFEGENIEGAPPLWCASAAGHIKIVKYLVSKGANVNSTTKSNSTALRAACFDGHLDIVKFLVDSGADIEIANRHGHTCLMIACYKGHWAIAKYLINKGADLNRKSVKGNTALHDCAECGSLEIMKLLLSHNAKMAPDAYQMTPLLAAAVTGHASIVEYLLTRSECSALVKVHALELLGATFVDKKHDMLSAYNYWKNALERRNVTATTTTSTITAANESTTTTTTTTIENENSNTSSNSSNMSIDEQQQQQLPQQVVNLDKRQTIVHNPIEAYDYATEFMSQSELDQIIADPDDMRMQALLIRERILGPTHPDTTYYIRYRGAVYADCGNFRKCILLWLYALDTQQKCLDPLHPMIQSSFLSFTELFQYMQKQLTPMTAMADAAAAANLRDGGGGGGGGSSSAPSSPSSRTSENTFNMLNMFTATVQKILQQAVEEIKRGMRLVEMKKKPDEQQQQQNEKVPAFDYAHFDRTLVVIVHFLIVVAESLRHCSPEETFKLKKLVYELIKLNPTNSKQSTLLHLASSRESSAIIKNHTLSSFPSTEVLKLLLECGADPNALDAEKNSPLHLAASNRYSSTTTNANSIPPLPPTVQMPLNAQQQQQQQQDELPNENNDQPAAAQPASPPPNPSSPSQHAANSERDGLIYLLLNAGCHLDACNCHNKTPADLYKGAKLYQVINPINYLSLQCLAAKVIKKHQIDYRDHLTTKLAAFVDMH